MVRALFIMGLVLPCAAGAAVPEIVIEGIDGRLRDNVLAHLRIDDETCETPSWRVRRLFREAESQAQAAMQALGYYSTKVSKSFEQTEECWSVRLTIDVGEPIRIRDIDVRIEGSGADVSQFRALVDNVPLESGQTLNHQDYETFKRRFKNVADGFGFFDGNFSTSRVDVYPAELAADVTLEFSTGVRYAFGDVTIDQDVVDDRLAQGYIDFEQGQPYEAVLITRLYEDLLSTGYFLGVDIRTTPNGDPDYDVTVAIRMNSAKHKTYSGGVGFGTDVGLKLRAGFLHRRLNKKGHQFEINANWSDVIADVGIGYKLPMNDPRNNWLNFDTGFKREDNASAKSDTYKIGAKMFRRQTINWLLTYFLDFGYEEWLVGIDEGESRLLIPGVSWEHTMERGPPRPLDGVKANLSISAAADALLSDVSFLQLRAFGKFVHKLWPGARGLARAELGATIKDEFDDLPASVRFFAGGDVSVRGYEYKSLGPQDELGLVVGGTHLAVFSYEVDQLIRENWSIAAFIDAGNAFNDYDDTEMAIGVGAGIRWFSLLGPIRLDLAFPLADDAPDDWRIHITLGPDL